MCSAIWNHPLHGPTKCGQCMECRLAYSREWAIRMTHEQQFHDRSCFLTLTYDNDHLPRFGQLIKKDLQDFFKRLRHVTGPFRYVACGEYGELGRRPHFHVALYGYDFRSDRVLSGESIQGDPMFVSPTLARVWGKGHLLQQTIGTLTFESSAYIARYICASIKGPNASPLPLACDPESGELVMPNPEFLIMSRKPAIGTEWFKKYFMTDVFPHGRVITAQGTPAPVPTAYKRMLYYNSKHHFENLGNPLNRLKGEFQATINKNFQSVPFERRKLEDTNERRSSRTAYAKARTSMFKRDIKGG